MTWTPGGPHDSGAFRHLDGHESVRSVEGVVLAGRGDDLVEARLDERRSLATDVPRLQPEEPVQPHLARPALPVPPTRTDVHPVAPVARLVLGVDVVVLAGEHQ